MCCAKPWSARDAFIEVLEGYTLSDLVKPRARLQAMLSIETVKPVRAHAAHEGAGENRVGGCTSRLGFRAEVYQ